MSKIDNIFKNGLGKKGMEYQPAYWEQMEGLLGSKKLGFWARYKLYFGLLALLLIGGSVGYYAATSQNSTPNSEVASSMVQDNTSVASYTNENVTKPTSTLDNTNESQLTSNPSRNNEPVPAQVSFGDRISPTKGANSNKVRVNEPDYVWSPPSNKKEAGAPDAPEIVTLVNQAPKTFDVFELSFIGNPEFTYEMVNNANQKLPAIKNGNFSKWHMYVAPYLSLNNYQRDLGSLATNTLKQQEQSKESLGFGLNIRLKKNNWSIETGVGVLNLLEKTNYISDKIDYSYDSSFHIVSRDHTTDPRGKPVALMSLAVDTTATVVGQEVTCTDCIARFSYITIPLHIGYEFRKGRLGYFGDAGITTSLLTKASGMYSENIGNDSITGLPMFMVTELPLNQDISSVLMQANANVGVRYYFTSKIGAWTSLGTMYSLNSMFGSHNQKPRVQSIKLGIQYRLF